MNPKVISATVAGLVAAIVTLTLLHYGTCQFYANPKAWQLYQSTGGKLPDSEHTPCREVGTKTLGVLTSTLATMLALLVKTDHGEP
jgi:hypothetical protein